MPYHHPFLSTGGGLPPQGTEGHRVAKKRRKKQSLSLSEGESKRTLKEPGPGGLEALVDKTDTKTPPE